MYTSYNPGMIATKLSDSLVNDTCLDSIKSSLFEILMLNFCLSSYNLKVLINYHNSGVNL